MVIGLLVAAATLPGGAHFDDIEVHVWRFGPDGKVAALNHVVDSYQHYRAAKVEEEAIASN